MTKASSLPRAEPVPAHLLRRISVEADVDPRTVARVIAGSPTRGIQRERIERACRAAGIELPARRPAKGERS